LILILFKFIFFYIFFNFIPNYFSWLRIWHYYFLGLSFML
jgi:hypothetical protein